jgi:hypothetical protein
MDRKEILALTSLVATLTCSSGAMAASSVEMNKIGSDDVANLRCMDARAGNEVIYSLKAVSDATGDVSLTLTTSHRFATVMPTTISFGIDAVSKSTRDGLGLRATALDDSGDGLALWMPAVDGGSSTLTLSPLLHHQTVVTVPMNCVNTGFGPFP